MGDYQNPVSATLTGIINAFKKQQKIGVLKDSDRVDGKTILITGANSGLGFALAVDLAKRGGEIIMACRSGIPEAGERVKKLSGSDTVRMKKVDLSDLNSIDNLVDELKSENAFIDILICNAATVPSKARRTPQGLETMFVVNYLSKFILLNRFWNEGLLKQDSNSRIIIISSESHRSPKPLDFETLGDYADFPMSKVVGFYGYYKLALTTLAREFSKRVNKEGINVAVHTICPGAVNSNIAKEAPGWVQPLLKLVFSIFFQNPSKAALPALYLAASNDLEGKTDIYLHMFTEKPVDDKAIEPGNGIALWNRSNYVLEKAKYPRTF